jgi:galactan endo-1,6-beta-galactosidase
MMRRSKAEKVSNTAVGRWLLAILVLWSSSIRADYSTTIQPQNTRGVWEGWGTSLCWWANVFGNRNDLADIVFTTNYTTLNGYSLPGLGMNIARYNAGACATNTIGGDSMEASPNIPAYRQMQGFWLNWYSADPASASWKWSADANQRSMLLKAKARGANLFELFSNSPMWWMCNNHNPSGSSNGSDNNLQSWNYQQHAVYLGNIAQMAKTNWGVIFDAVEPFNEPSANWWTATGAQEGCHVDPSIQATVIGHLRAELNNRGLSGTKVAASDESYYDQATGTWNSFGATTKSQVGRVNVHGYQGSGGRRDLLYSAVAGKQLWNSEYGDSDGTGMTLARNLTLDFRWLRITAWCYWQPFDSGGWGLVQSNPGDNWIGSPNPKHYVVAHYTRHIRPGMTIIDGGEDNTVAAYDAAKRKLVLVTVNYGTPQWITYSLTNFAIAAGPIRKWNTVTGAGGKYQASAMTLADRNFKSWFETNSIQTFEIQNVHLNPAPVLKIDRVQTNTGLLLSWPETAGDYRLYGSTNSTLPAQWTQVTGELHTNAGVVQVWMSPTNVFQLFRLGWP